MAPAGNTSAAAACDLRRIALIPFVQGVGGLSLADRDQNTGRNHQQACPCSLQLDAQAVVIFVVTIAVGMFRRVLEVVTYALLREAKEGVPREELRVSLR